tara:strand:- start:1030 stop:1482 length:453 start_codon:yes stop_codon:yes gene_type:complete
MVKNKIGGNKTKKKASRHYFKKEYSAEDLKKISGQEYAWIMEKYGDGRFRAICYDKVKRLAILRGALRGKIRVEKGDVVLVSIRDFQDDKVDIIAKFTNEEISKLVIINEITTSFIETGTCIKINTVDVFEDGDKKILTDNDELLDVDDI